jgi:trigger factor
MGQQKTVAEYREAIKTEIEKYKKDNSDTEAQIAAMEQVIENSEFELSEEGINKEYTDMKAEYEKMATAYGMDIKQFAELSNMTEEEFDVKLKENAENRAKQKLIIDEIFKKEKMSLEDADYADLEEQTGMAKNDLYLQYGQSMVDDYVKTVKVEQFMVDNATKTIKPAQSPEVVTEAQTKAQTESKADAEETSEQTKSSEAKQ